MGLRLAIALLGTAVLLPRSNAQVRGVIAMPARTGASAGMGRGFGVSVREQSGGRGFHHPVLLGAPYFYAEDYSQPAVVEPPPPQVVVVEVPAATEPPKERAAEPLLIEWRGDRYVRLSAAPGTTAREGRASLDYAEGKLTAFAQHNDPAPAAASVLP